MMFRSLHSVLRQAQVAVQARHSLGFWGQRVAGPAVPASR